MKMVTELDVKGMSCQNCVRHVREALEGIEGVEHAEVSLESGYAVVRHDEWVDTDALVRAVQEEGYDAKFKDQRS